MVRAGTYLTSRMALAQILSHQAILQITESGTFLEMVFRQKHVPKAKFLRFDFQVFNDGWMSIKAGDDVAAIGIDLLGVDSVGGYALFFNELLDLESVSSLDMSRYCRR